LYFKIRVVNTKGFKGIDSYDCVFMDVCVFMETSVVADCIADASVRAVFEPVIEIHEYKIFRQIVHWYEKFVTKAKYTIFLVN